MTGDSIARMMLISYTATPGTRARFAIEQLYVSGVWPEDIADMCRMDLADVQAYLVGGA